MKSIGMIFLLVGCSHIPFFSDDEKSSSDTPKLEAPLGKSQEKLEAASSLETSRISQVDVPKEKGLLGSIAGSLGVGGDDSSKEQSSLQQARILARVNELENTLNLQTQKIKVLEKAITLGIIPEELKKGQAPFRSLDADYGGDSFLSDLAPDDSSRQNTSKAGSAARKSAFKKELSEGVAVFGKGEFGKAFIIFQKADQSYGEEDKQGETLFWMGRSWYALKEYQTARQYFQDMIRASPTSSKVGQAKLYMAQADMNLGMLESAIEGLRDIIRDHQDSPSSQEARKLLAGLKDTL